jgi:hypothetical protein
LGGDEERQMTLIGMLFAMSGQVIHHGVQRNLKHISIIAYLSAGRESIISYIITFHDSESFCNRLKKPRVRFGVDFLLKSRQKPYVNANIFKDYIKCVFISYLNELRSSEQFADQATMLLMDK